MYAKNQLLYFKNFVQTQHYDFILIYILYFLVLNQNLLTLSIWGFYEEREMEKEP